jgi:hypothetical protein
VAPEDSSLEPTLDGGEPRQRHPGRWVAGLLLAWVLIGIAQLGVGAWHARAGERATATARHTANPEGLARGAPLLKLREAHSQFREARRWLGGPVTASLHVVPILGRQIRSVQALAAGAEEVTAVAVDSVGRARALLVSPHSSGPERVAVLRGLGRIAADASRRLAPVHLGPDRALIPPVAHVHDRFADELGRLRVGLERGSSGLLAAADLLQGPRRYLVLAANNAEMRAGSGMFLSAGFVETAGGQLRMGPFLHTDALLLPPGVVPLSGDLEGRWGWLHPNEEWRNLAVSPRFDVTAALAAKMWAATGNPPVDGVLALDAQTLASVLAATGPVNVAGTTVDATNAVERILHGQYVAHAADPTEAARRDELGDLAHTALDALQQRDWSVGRLAQGFAEDARGRHLLAWSARPEEQQAWQEAGIDGSLDQNSMLAAVLNRGGNKLDRFLEVSANLAFTRTGGVTHAVLRLHLRNNTPEGEPTYVAGPNLDSPAGNGVYLGIVAVNLPGAASNGRIDGTTDLLVAGADGATRVVAAPVQLGRGEERTVVVRFELPAVIVAFRVLPSARIPAVRWSAPGLRWQDSAQQPVTVQAR